MDGTVLHPAGSTARSLPGRHRIMRIAIAVVVAGALAFGGLVSNISPARALDRPEGLRPGPNRLGVSHPLQESGHEIGFIQIAAIDLNVTVRSGVAMSVIDQGPAHWAGTSIPGEAGNVVLAGHRTTKTRPFYYLNRLGPGDKILMGDGTSFPSIYTVTETLLVSPQDVWITYDTGEPIVTLFACHPRGSARQRIVVRGALRTGLPIQ